MDTKELNVIWNNCLRLLEEETTTVSFKTWLKPLEPVSFENNLLVLSTDNINNKTFIIKRFEALIKQAFNVVSNEYPDLDIIVKTNEADEKPQKKDIQSKYDKYTFDNFVVGGSNRMAHAACVAVADAPGLVDEYNPLFLYGGVGLGKTHLIHAIQKYINENSPETKVALVTSEKFTNELVEAIQEKRRSEFREKYRKMDILLIDDIQFIAGKESIEEEFFNTFNTLHEANKQIVITSDRPPQEIKTLQSRLVSRFQWGIQLDIQPPDFDTKLAILKKKVKEMNLEIDDSILYFICENVNSNIRELEGALNRIMAYKSLINKEITLELAEEALKEYGPRDKSEITPEFIIEHCSKVFKIPVAELYSDNRKKEVSQARKYTMFIIREILGMSFPKIGTLFNKDHSTAMYSIKTVEKQIGESPIEKKNLTDIINDIKNDHN